MYTKINDFKLRPFNDEDYGGIVSLRNTLYPDHPKTIEMVRRHDKTHKRKIKCRRFVFEQNNYIVVCAGY